MGRLFLPKFDGSSKCSTKAWVEKIDIYFQLNKVPEMEAIKIVALHFEGEHMTSGSMACLHWVMSM